MEENELYDRIGETDLNPTYKDGQTYQHTDINQMLGILKTAINENYYDIQRLLNGAKTVGNANQLDGATLSRYIDETLQSDDNKVPSSQQAKAYMDELFAGYSAPVRGEDYWTNADKEEIIDDTATAVVEEITPSLEEALAAKANINDIPTKISDLQNDSDFLSENNLQMVNTVNVQNGSQITDATGYGSLNKIYGDTEQNGTPTPNNLVNVENVTDELSIAVSNSDDSLSQVYNLSLGDIELCKIEQYRDYIFYDNGKWYIHKEIGKIVLDGTETWDVVRAYGKAFPIVDTPNILISTSASTEPLLYSNYYEAHKLNDIVSNTPLDYGVGKRTNHSQLLFRNVDTALSLDDFKNWLTTHNTVVYYVLASPTTIEITDLTLIAQLNIIHNFSLYADETNFTITSDNLIPGLNITYAITNRDFYSKEEVNDKLNELDNNINEKVNFIFPKFMPNQASGDCNLIKYKDKNILFDCYSTSAWTYIKEMLDDNSVKHIDYFVLTHYHTDHYGNFKNLVNNGYIDNSTRLFMPAEVSIFPSDIYTEYKNFCNQNNLTYYVPYENEEVIIDDLKITFNNCDPEKLEELNFGQNDCSTVALIEYGNIKAYYSGDAGMHVHNRMIDIGFLKGKIDLYKQGHHGIDFYASNRAVNLINPTFTVQTGGILDFQTSNFALEKETNLLLSKGTQYYPCHMQTDYIKFVSDGKGISCKQGTTNTNAGLYNGEPYGVYIDKSVTADSIQNGTQEHPFREIMQAMGYANALKGVQEIYFYLAPGTYGNFNPEATAKKNRVFIQTGKDKRIVLIGDENDRTSVILKGVYALNSKVTLRNLTIHNDLMQPLYSVQSDVEFDNVLITSPTGERVDKIGLQIRYNSNVLVRGNTRIEHCSTPIVVREGSKCILGNISFGDNASGAEVYTEGVLLTNGTLSFDTDAEKRSFPYYKITKMPEQIMNTHNNWETNVTLVKSLTNYDWVEIFYRTVDDVYGSVKVYSPNGKKVSCYAPFITSTDVYVARQCNIDLSGTSLTIVKQCKISRDSTDNKLYYNGTGGFFNIEKVIGGYIDYKDIV